MTPETLETRVVDIRLFSDQGDGLRKAWLEKNLATALKILGYRISTVQYEVRDNKVLFNCVEDYTQDDFVELEFPLAVVGYSRTNIILLIAEKIGKGITNPCLQPRLYRTLWESIMGGIRLIKLLRR